MNKPNTPPKISNVARRYLDTFAVILDTMIRCMNDAKLTDSISGNFIKQMIPHHRAAIDMSLNILRYTTDIEVQNIALNIIAEQTKSIDDMISIEVCCRAKTNTPIQLKPYMRAHNDITQKMFGEMKSSPHTNNINYNFLCQIIPLQRGAVRMCENAMKYVICQELHPVIKSIICCNKTANSEMQKLLSKMNISNHQKN